MVLQITFVKTVNPPNLSLRFYQLILCKRIIMQMKINNFFFFMIYKCSVLTFGKATIFRNSALAS
jgi:hypothetical protein